MQYYKTFGEFEGSCEGLEASIKSLMLRLPVGLPTILHEALLADTVTSQTLDIPEAACVGRGLAKGDRRLSRMQMTHMTGS